MQGFKNQNLWQKTQFLFNLFLLVLFCKYNYSGIIHQKEIEFKNKKSGSDLFLVSNSPLWVWEAYPKLDRIGLQPFEI